MYRPSEKVLARMMDRSAKLRDQMEPLKRLVDGFNGPFWADVSARLQTRIEHIREKRADLSTLAKTPEIDLKIDLAVEEVLKDVISMPDDCAKLLKRMQADHAKMGEAIRDKRRGLKSFKG